MSNTTTQHARMTMQLNTHLQPSFHRRWRVTLRPHKHTCLHGLVCFLCAQPSRLFTGCSSFHELGVQVPRLPLPCAPSHSHSCSPHTHTHTRTRKHTLPLSFLLSFQTRDVLAKAKTGTGKTIAFLIPVVERLARQPVVGGLVCQALQALRRPGECVLQ